MNNLKEYNNKRNFNRTNEPEGKVIKLNNKKLRYVIQHHLAKKDHYDLRLEWNGVYVSFAIPKGPSFNPKDKRLAVHVEDHPISYGNFEGIIEKGQYGAGIVMLWDKGYWYPESNPNFNKSIKFELIGERLKGKWSLIKMNDDNYLLIKENDKYKKSTKGRYKVELENDEIMTLYEDTILKYNLLLTKDIPDDKRLEINLYNQECEVYQVALDSIKARYKSIKELKLFLLRKEYPEDLIDKVVKKLQEQGYLNDSLFCKSYINNQILTTNRGPYKIRNLLLEKGIDEDIINEEITVFTEDIEREKINKLIVKYQKTNHKKGGVVLKQKIYNEIKNLGYSIEILNDVINSYSFENNKEIAKKEYEKLYNKYSRKYSGYELERIIKEKQII